MIHHIGESGPEMFVPAPGSKIIPVAPHRDRGLSFVEVVVLITAIAVICILAGIIHTG